MFSKRIISSAVVLILVMIMIHINKPTLFYNHDNSIKQFGTGKEESIYSLGVFVSFIAIISFYIFSMIDLINS